VSSAGEVLNQQVTRSQQDIQQTTQQAFELAADRQAFATQQAALAQTAHDARMATIQNQMAGQAQAQLEQAQAKNQGWPYPIADALIVIYPHEPFQANVEVQQGIQGDIHQATDLQGRVGEGQHHVAEKFRQAVEAIKRAAEAKRQAREARNGPLPEQNLQAIVVLRPFADGMQDKPGEVLILFWDWQEGGVVGEQGSVGHVATAVKSKNEWIIIHSQFPHSNGGKPCPAGPNTTIATPYDLLDAENRRKPNSAYLLTVPNLGGFANYMIADLEKPLWEMAPGRQGGSTNCTYGTIHGLRAGGVPLSSMWANQTLIIPLAPYLPRDLRTALERDVSFNLIHNYKIYHKNELIEAIHWEKTKHE
jgi:hypothetical protein